MQPIVAGGDRPRFKANAIVRALLDHGRRTGLDLDRIAEMEFTPGDRRQFAQLIGYSLSGYLELPCVTGRHAADASALASGRPAKGPGPRARAAHREP